MFAAIELGRALTKKEFSKHERKLREDLLPVQIAAREAGLPVIVIISGVEGAGKGEVVNKLSTWADSRGVDVHVFWDESDEERERPRFWRFWRCLPARGRIGVLFGSWYTQPIVDRVFDKIDDGQLEADMEAIKAFEHMLVLDGALIIKLWFHLSIEAQLARYEADEKVNPGQWALAPGTEAYAARSARFQEVSADAIQRTDTGLAPWNIIEADDGNYRDIEAGRIVLESIERRLKEGRPKVSPPPLPTQPLVDRTILDTVDLSASLNKKAYREELDFEQRRLHGLVWRSWAEKIPVVAAFEGWDAAGKGGTIRRVVQAMDPRLVRVVPVAAPTDEERAHHYLWRFWRQLQRDGRVTIFDRSWYGRLLVERVEGFAQPEAWGRAYHEINAFESQLASHGTVVCKFWVHIDSDEQMRRFEERKRVKHKQHKLTEEDWRNRERWPDYARAVHDMVERTSTASAPWTVVPGNDKRYARVCVVRTIADRLEAALAERG